MTFPLVTPFWKKTKFYFAPDKIDTETIEKMLASLHGKYHIDPPWELNQRHQKQIEFRFVSTQEDTSFELLYSGEKMKPLLIAFVFGLLKIQNPYNTVCLQELPHSFLKAVEDSFRRCFLCGGFRGNSNICHFCTPIASQVIWNLEYVSRVYAKLLLFESLCRKDCWFFKRDEQRKKKIFTCFLIHPVISTGVLIAKEESLFSDKEPCVLVTQYSSTSQAPWRAGFFVPTLGLFQDPHLKALDQYEKAVLAIQPFLSCECKKGIAPNLPPPLLNFVVDPVNL